MRTLARTTTSALLSAVLLLSPIWALAQSARQAFHQQNIPPAGGGFTISFVTATNAGNFICSGSLPNLAISGTLNVGDLVSVQTRAFNGAGTTDMTPGKASGTATIGSFTERKTQTAVSGANNIRVSMWDATVTGSGTLTLSFSPSNSNTCDSSSAAVFRPSGGSIVVDGTASSTSGTSATEAAGAITTSSAGVVVMSSTEVSTGDFTYTLSDTVIYSDSTGSTDMTGQAQYKITSSSGTPNLTAGTGNSWLWVAAQVAYKAQ